MEVDIENISLFVKGTITLLNDNDVCVCVCVCVCV